MHNDQSLLRKDGLAARRSLTIDERDVGSELIAEKVVHAHWFQRSKYVACYLAAADEVNTWAIISRAWRMKKRVFAPVLGKTRRMQFQEITPDTELIRNELGLLEPIDGDIAVARMFDIVFTPLAAFDETLQRIGMGGGYFDRTFAFTRHRMHWQRPRMIGLAFACQKVAKIPPNPWDIRVFTVITEEA